MVRGFREVGWVAAVAGTALGCYMVSLKVAAERAALDQVQNRIVLAQRDIRVLQTEIGTRGRLEQLESWNVKVLALSAPKAQQFLEGEFQLATLTAPKKTVDPAAPVVLASAPAPAPTPRVADPDASGSSARDLMQVASFRRDLPEPGEKTVDKPKVAPARPVKPAAKAATAAASTDKTPAAATTARKEKVAAKAPTDSAKSKAPPKPATPPANAKSKDAKARQ
ncbi:hypothetical protein [Sphingomonas astaxanthinifaciens]|uniref:Cell division protein FtsL n=1 Tax=Sphingomonas astaxanthinifaciens DSM 22298 TaxID=1123267 RepID=A0ABQ5Z719_9SPHN|nr:hypothetical protein [Sphingomonas astaxanthinifaciens]GLR47206.1 hypothetical protein GCM10007925_09170 [Sphingomonas astaxanthinifaciens DSM 22298]